MFMAKKRFSFKKKLIKITKIKIFFFNLHIYRINLIFAESLHLLQDGINCNLKEWG